MAFRYLILDFETRSEANLKLVGSFEYAAHPSTQILCAAYRLGTKEELLLQDTILWSPFLNGLSDFPLTALLDSNVKIVAHNSGFEQDVIKFVLSRILKQKPLQSLSPDRFICTAAMSRVLAFPASLEGVGEAIGLPVQKDKVGHRLMLKMSKPRKATKADKTPWHNKKEDLLRLMDYCKIDVDVTTDLFLKLPELTEPERKTWLLDQKINARGFKADRELVLKILKMIEEEQENLRGIVSTNTSGEIDSLNRRDAFLKWLRTDGLDLPDLTKKTVEDALKSDTLHPKHRLLLEARQQASKSSTAKYVQYAQRSAYDGRVRGNMIYHGASTGRFNGAGLQPLNLFKSTIPYPEVVANFIKKEGLDLEGVRLLFGNPMNVFASLLRTMIVAPEGKELIGGDFAGIELRVLFWAAGHEKGLEAIREGRDLYCEQATHIYDRPITKENDFERQLGKKVILGAGFGLGHAKFFKSCEQDGLKVSEELAKQAIQSYRETHYPVPELWSNIEKAAIAAVKHPGKSFGIGVVVWFKQGNFLYCRLPSGRKLAYYRPELHFEVTKWGGRTSKLYHWDLIGPKKEWKLEGTWGGKLVENIVQAIARDVMVESMHRVEDYGFETLISVHDELLVEYPIDPDSEGGFQEIMEEVPIWAKGLPINAATWKGLRYAKK